MKYLLPFLFLLLFSGCVPKQDVVENIFQTNSATIVKKDYKRTLQHLLMLKSKLDKRNPNSYNKEISNKIYSQIDALNNGFYLKYKNKDIKNYKEYLQIAFSKTNIEHRNDYLILGLYYMIYDAYDIKDGHQLTALLYDREKLQRLYHNLQIFKWKFKTAKDLDETYLFLTWQNNWQIELEKKVKNGLQPSWTDIQNLHFIKNNKESIFDHSNFSFEVLLTQMIDNTHESLDLLGVEVTEMSVEAITTVFLFL